MTIGKLVRVIAICLLGALLCAPLSSCAAQKEDYPSDLLAKSSDVAYERYFRVVISPSSSAQLWQAANELALRLAEKTGAEARVVYDTEQDGRKENVTEVILGNADRSVARALLKDLKKDDYLCRAVEGSLVLGGKTDGATLAAIERFYNEILPAATAELLLGEEGGFFYRGSYPYEGVTLNGFDLNDYRIVCSDGASEELLRLANILRDAIAEKSGYVLQVSFASEYGNVGKGIFLVEERSDGDGMPARLIPDGHGISLCADDTLGVSAAMRELFALLFADSQNGVCAAEIVSVKDCPYDREAYRLASVVSDHWLPNATSNTVINQLETICSQYAPHAILFGAMSESFAQYVKIGLRDYDVTEGALSDGAVLPMGQNQSGISLLSVAYAKEGALAISVCRVGSERDGFLLVRISGRVSESCSVELPQGVTETDLPVVVWTHVIEDGGKLSLSNLEGNGIQTVMTEEFVTKGVRYTVSCYATENAFSIASGVQDNELGYREITVRRRSLFETE